VVLFDDIMCSLSAYLSTCGITPIVMYQGQSAGGNRASAYSGVYFA
jgi:hypothetical protein